MGPPPATPWFECDARGRSTWVWPGDSTALRGSALLEPAMAQHTRVVRIREAVSEAEIGLLFAAAERHIRDHAAEEGLAGQSDVEGKLYLHHRQIPPELLSLVARITEEVRRVDYEHWGLLSDAKVAASGPIGPRCVEFHAYDQRLGRKGRERCANHIDAGSLFTADIMLTSTADFEGGDLETSVDMAGKKRVTTAHAFERGDCLVFLSHKHHAVSDVLSGRRAVCVIEFWQGGCCTANHRCADGGVGRDPTCGNKEGEATYYSRFTQEEIQCLSFVHLSEMI